MLSNLPKTGEKCFEKCNFCIKYFDKIKFYANRPYLECSELKSETHIYIFFGLMNHIRTYCYEPTYADRQVLANKEYRNDPKFSDRQV